MDLRSLKYEYIAPPPPPKPQTDWVFVIGLLLTPAVLLGLLWLVMILLAPRPH